MNGKGPHYGLSLSVTSDENTYQGTGNLRWLTKRSVISFQEKFDEIGLLEAIIDIPGFKISETLNRASDGYSRVRKIENATIEEPIESFPSSRVWGVVSFFHQLHLGKNLNDTQAIWIGKNLVPIDIEKDKLIAEQKKVATFSRGSEFTTVSNLFVGVRLKLTFD